MIYLIGGPPRSGKSTLAQQIAQKRRCSWLSVDALEAIVMTSLSETELKKTFPKRTMRRTTHRNNDKMYQRFTTTEIVNAYKKQAKASWSAVEMLIEVTQQEERDFVIEGYHLTPAFMTKVTEKYGKANIRSLVLSRKDPAQIVSDCLKSTTQHDWFLKQTQKTETYQLIAKMIAHYGNYFEKEAIRYGIEQIDMDIHFKRQLRRAQESLLANG